VKKPFSRGFCGFRHGRGGGFETQNQPQFPKKGRPSTSESCGYVIYMKIGFFGGTFNPIHNAHINVALAARDKLGLDKVMLVIAADPPHKGNEFLAHQWARYDMVCAAVKEYPELEVSTVEFELAPPSYSVKTLRLLKERSPNDEIYFILGSDSFLKLERWYEYREIMKLCKFGVYLRGGDDVSLVLEYKERYLSQYGAQSVILDGEVSDVSSTSIRELVAQNRDFSDILPGDVCEYIDKNGLYGRYWDLSAEAIRVWVKEHVPERTYYHTVRTAQTAALLAEKYGADPKKAYLAGLLHDCSKGMEISLMRELTEKGGGVCVDEYGNNPQLLHAGASVALARDVFGITDEEILGAIRYHTLGREKMSVLEMVVYCADLIEPGRRFDDVEELRKKDAPRIEKLFLECARVVNRFVRHNGFVLHPDTPKAIAYYERLLGGNK